MNERIEAALKELSDAAVDYARDEWANDALSQICGDFDRRDWASSDMAVAFERISTAIGGTESAAFLISYLFGWMLERRMATIEEWDDEGGKNKFRRLKTNDGVALFEDDQINIGDVRIIVTPNAAVSGRGA